MSNELHPLLSAQREKAKKLFKRICLPEALSDERTTYAVKYIIENALAYPIIIGKKEVAAAKGIDLSKCEVFDPEEYDMSEFVQYYQNKRREKEGKTDEEVKQLLLSDANTFGMLLVATGRADGLVSGAMSSTAKVLSPAFRLLGTDPNTSIVSSIFLMITNKTNYGSGGVLAFGDCAVNPDPNAEQLAEIAISSAETFAEMTETDPKVAMLSFSTYGSGRSDSATKVSEAFKLAQSKRPDLLIDGELQADAAIEESVADLKAPSSKVAGHANVLIFPNLDAGNIGYKLAQRFGDMHAIGPILQGIAKPVNDLSRGCNGQDIVQMVCITSLQVI